MSDQAAAVSPPSGTGGSSPVSAAAKYLRVEPEGTWVDESSGRLRHPNASPRSPSLPQTAATAGYQLDRPRVGVTSHFYVEPTSQGARETCYPYYSCDIGNNMPGARGQLLPADAFDAWAGPRAPCSPAAPKRSSTRSCGNTNCSATTASSPRSASVASPSPTPPAHRTPRQRVLPVIRRETLAGTRREEALSR